MTNRLMMIIVISMIYGCGSDDIPFQDELQTIGFTCCGENPFANSNVDNLDQSEGELAIPWFITPNGDDVNDYFSVFKLDLYPNNNFKIYNLGDELIYEADGFGSGQNRFFPENNDQIPAEGVYRYRLVVENESTYINEGYFCVVKSADSELSTAQCGNGLDPAIDGD